MYVLKLNYYGVFYHRFLFPATVSKLIEVDLHTGTTPGSAQEGNSPRQGDNPGETPPGQDSRHKDRTKEHEEKEDTVQVKEKGQQAASQSANPFSDPGVTVAVILACIGVVSCLAVVALQVHLGCVCGGGGGRDRHREREAAYVRGGG